jgi:hypothetical protein
VRHGTRAALRVSRRRRKAPQRRESTRFLSDAVRLRTRSVIPAAPRAAPWPTRRPVRVQTSDGERRSTLGRASGHGSARVNKSRESLDASSETCHDLVVRAFRHELTERRALRATDCRDQPHGRGRAARRRWASPDPITPQTTPHHGSLRPLPPAGGVRSRAPAAVPALLACGVRARRARARDGPLVVRSRLRRRSGRGRPRPATRRPPSRRPCRPARRASGAGAPA